MAWRWIGVLVAVLWTAGVAAAPSSPGLHVGDPGAGPPSPERSTGTAPQTQPPASPTAQPAAAATSAPQPSVPQPAATVASTDAAPPVVAKVEGVLTNALTLVRPGQIGLATIWDGNKFVQCRHMDAHDILCEAAGTAMQPSLGHLLTLDRAMRLAALAWTVDPHFGNYIHVVPGDIGAKTLARHVLRALGEGYDADLGHVEARSTWVRDTKCPPRNGPRQDLAGSINDAAAMASTALHACAYAPAATEPARSVADLFGLFGLRVKGEIERLIVNNDAKGIHVVLTGKPGYVQCAPDAAPPAVYCEAASADSVPTLGKVLTPERVAQLHAMGFVDPGRAPNYSRDTPLAQADAGRLAGELLTILFDVYGYRGRPVLGIATEKPE